MWSDRTKELLRCAGVGLLLVALGACDSKGKDPLDPGQVSGRRLSLDELKDPKTCSGCHPKHYREWASSMHAYAALDPVFRAMNQRGQRETNGALGDFCVKCHAPMAVREGLTTDGLNLDQLPEYAKGVTCYFCHNAVSVGDHFNGDVKLADDDVMRANIKSPVDPGVHGAASSTFHDNSKMDSSLLCGSCHDVKNDKGVLVERTLEQYSASAFSLSRTPWQSGGDSCQGCHMPVQGEGPAAVVPGRTLPNRELHEHLWPAVDVALTDFPDREAFRHHTECELATTGANVLRVLNDRPGEFEVVMETSSGHAQPSGAAVDRRLWLEFVAYDAQGNVLLESGKLERYTTTDPTRDLDPNLCMFRDHFENEAGEEVHMFWEAAKRSSDSRELPISIDFKDKHTASCGYLIPGRQQPTRIEMRMHMRPIGMDVLQSLVDSGDLDPAIKDAMPTFTLHYTAKEWRAEDERLHQLPVTIDCD